MRDEDEVFSRNVLEEYFENSKHSKWVLACSRQTKEDAKCPLQLSGYVQDVLRAASEITLDANQSMGDMLKAALATEEKEDTYVLICGNTNGMGRDVY